MLRQSPPASHILRALETISYQHIAHCTLINRSIPDQPSVQDTKLQYTYIFNPRATRTILLVHGWPIL
ncbi:hypothetical protein JB92DRAFT_1045221 [Gautieria morchelliformis]|nr:hypothetical protein JB92DRAFT_1045221 [Gautieria morchelliformis]